MSPRDALSAARLYGLFDCAYADPAHLEITLDRMIQGGVQVLQLRAKDLPPEQILPLARRAADHLRNTPVPFIVNDHPAIAAEVQAAGCHIGQDDGSLPEIREKYPQLLLGRSTHSVAQAQTAAQDAADYIGFGPLYPTPTKAGRPAIGLKEISAAHGAYQGPIFCIGGIKEHNLPEVLAAGARRVVVVSGILQAPDIVATCLAIRQQLDA